MLKGTAINTAIFVVVFTILQRLMSGVWPPIEAIVTSAAIYFLLVALWSAYSQRTSRAKPEDAPEDGGSG